MHININYQDDVNAGDAHCPEPGAKKNAPSWWRDYKPKKGKGRGGYGNRGGRGKGKGRGCGKGKGSNKVTPQKRAEARDTLLSMLAHERKKKKQESIKARLEMEEKKSVRT